MRKNVKNQSVSLFKWIWQSYLRTALIPLVLIELVFVGIYFFTNHWSQREMISFLKNQVQSELQQNANRESAVIQQQLASISNATELYRRQTAKALSMHALLDGEDAGRLAYSSEGAYYATRDSKYGGAAVFYSGFVPVKEKEREKVARVLTTQSLMKDIKESQPLAASIYLNTFDSLNVIYPYFDVLSQYAPLANIPSYNFYYKAEENSNPERKVIWTDVYLDPAGHGWMASSIAPVYRDDFLEGVVGIDVTVNTITSQILKMEIPYGGYGVLVGKDGSIIALPEKGEEDWGLDELTDRHYDEAVLEDTFKPDQFNLYKREDMAAFSQEVAKNTSGFSNVPINGKTQVVSWSTINETGWKLLLIVPEKNVYAEVDWMSQKLFQIGTMMIAGLVLFYSIFFYILSKKTRKMSLNISQPLLEINGIAKRIGEGDYYQDKPDLHVSELRDTASSLVEMGRQLGEANKSLLEAQEILKKREANLHALVNSVEDAIVEVNEQGFVINIWSEDQNVLNKSYQKGSIDHLFERDTAEQHKKTIKHVVRTGASESVEFVMETNKGLRWFQARLSPLDRKARTVVASARDITERKEMEKSILIAKEEAEKANKAKSQFLSSMSHELRTPLNAVLGFAQVLKIDSDTPLNTLQRQSVDEILKAGNHLLMLINEVLDLAKIESGKLALSIEPIQIRPMVEEVFTIIKPLADKYKIAIDIRFSGHENQCVLADNTRIKQILLNLLSNAIKYNKEAGKVTFYYEKVDNTIRFHVIDNGEGIPEAELKDIFEPFYRANDVDCTVEGTGIGLAVAKQLTELMNGRIHVESQIGSGSHFQVELPFIEFTFNIDEAPALLSKTQSTREDDKVREILYIEDSRANLLLVERVLSHIPNVKMFSAASGELCMDLARVHKLDLIMLDINLPGMNGYEVLMKLQESDETSSIPVIALSANAMPKNIERGLAAGFVDYITKPINVKSFINKITEILEDTSK